MRFLVSLLAFLAAWVGAATAHDLKGWRTLVMPVVNVLVLLAGFVILYTVFGGFVLSINSLAIDFGLLPGS